MKVWHFSEMAYHPAWPELGDFVPGDHSEPAFRPENRR